jgi:uncharacterized membrane protein YoaK (UPF0700 family)
VGSRHITPLDIRLLILFDLFSGGRSLTRLDRHARLFAAALAGVAGYIDAAGFLMTGGYFVSFMSGNSTRLSVGIFHAAAEAVLAASLVAAFVAGVVAGATIRRAAPRRPEVLILTLVSTALGLSAFVSVRGLEFPAALLLAASMGSANMVFAEAGEVRIGVTYMTGALVKVGKGLAAAFFGESRFLWAPHLLLWIGLVGGAILGAASYSRLGPNALWPAGAAMALLAILSLKIFPLELATATPEATVNRRSLGSD